MRLVSEYHTPEALKLWGPPTRGALLVLWGGESCLYEGYVYFERNVGAT
jgi:hypothetical protein